MKTIQLDLYDGQICPWHIKARDAPYRFLMLCCGRKARKTTFIINRLVFKALTDPNQLTYPYFAPFRKQAKQIVWDDHLSRILRMLNAVGIRYKINQSDLTIRFEGRGKIQVDGLDNAEAHRGKSDWGYVGIDEAASTNLKYVWQEIIRPNLQVHKAGAVIGGTPKGFDEFYNMLKWGDHEHVIDDKDQNTQPDFMTFHATSYDNPFNDPEEIEAARRTTTPDYFRREYLALPTRFSGLVYPEFEEGKHVSWFDHEQNDHGDYYFGMDFATRGYTALLIGKVKSNGHIYILDEYKERNETAINHGEKILEMLEKYADLSKYSGYADPAGWAKNQQNKDLIWSLADEYIELGLPLVQGNNEVLGGINFIRQLLISGKLYIHGRCEKLIAEFYQYQWKEQKEAQASEHEEPEKVRKINDHLLDALRYMVYSKPSAPDEEETVRPTLFPGQFIEMPLKMEEKDPNRDVFEEMNIPSFYD